MDVFDVEQKFILDEDDRNALQTAEAIWPFSRVDELYSMVESSMARVSSIDSSTYPGNAERMGALQRKARLELKLGAMQNQLRPHVLANEANRFLQNPPS